MCSVQSQLLIELGELVEGIGAFAAVFPQVGREIVESDAAVPTNEPVGDQSLFEESDQVGAGDVHHVCRLLGGELGVEGHDLNTLTLGEGSEDVGKHLDDWAWQNEGGALSGLHANRDVAGGQLAVLEHLSDAAERSLGCLSVDDARGDLAAVCRGLREAAGMSGAEAAAFLGGERSLISHVEAGRWGIKPERVQFLASHYAATDQVLIDALIAMARERNEGWWERFRGTLPPAMLDLSELEHHATYVRAAQALVVPGIFQTDDYARAVFSTANPGLTDEELSARVEHRTMRRAIFERETPTRYDAILHEVALRANYGSRGITRRQLEFLLSMADVPSISIRVIPFDIGSFIGLTPQMFYVGGPIAELDSVVVESAHDTVFLDAQAQLSRYRALFSALESVSLGADESRKLIYRIGKEK